MKKRSILMFLLTFMFSVGIVSGGRSYAGWGLTPDSCQESMDLEEYFNSISNGVDAESQPALAQPSINKPIQNVGVKKTYKKYSKPKNVGKKSYKKQYKKSYKKPYKKNYKSGTKYKKGSYKKSAAR